MGSCGDKKKGKVSEKKGGISSDYMIKK